MLANNQTTPETQEKPSKFSFDALRKNPIFHGFQLKLGKSAKEIKTLVEKLWLE